MGEWGYRIRMGSEPGATGHNDFCDLVHLRCERQSLVAVRDRSTERAEHFGGTLYLTSGPAFNAVPFDPAAVTRTAVGAATFKFANGNSGSFTYVVDLGDGISKATQSKAITRQVFRAPGTVCQ